MGLNQSVEKSSKSKTGCPEEEAIPLWMAASEPASRSSDLPRLTPQGIRQFLKNPPTHPPIHPSLCFSLSVSILLVPFLWKDSDGSTRSAEIPE